MAKKRYRISVILCIYLVALIMVINIVQGIIISSFTKKSTADSYAMDCTQITNAYSLANNQLYGTVLKDAALQAETALELVLACMRQGSAQGFTTSSGISAAKDVTKEDPLTDRSLINQCFIVPFLPIKK